MKHLYLVVIAVLFGISAYADELVINANPMVINVAGGQTLTIDSISYAEGFDATSAITKSGDGTLILSGNNSSKFAGLTVNGGAVQISAWNNLGSGNIVLSGGGLNIAESISQGNQTITVSGNGFIDIAEGKTFTANQTKFVVKNSTLTQKGKGLVSIYYWNPASNIENGTWIIAGGGVLHFVYSWRGSFSYYNWLSLDIREGGTFRFSDVTKVHNVILKGGRIEGVNPKTIETAEYQISKSSYQLKSNAVLPDLDDFSPKSRGVALCGKITVLPAYDAEGNAIPSEIICPIGAELANGNYGDTVFDVKEGAVLEMNAQLFNGKATSGNDMTVDDRAKDDTKFVKQGKGEIKFNKPCSVNGTFEVQQGIVTIAKGASFASTVDLSVASDAVINLEEDAVFDGSSTSYDVLQTAEVWMDASTWTTTDGTDSKPVKGDVIPNRGRTGGNFYKFGNNSVFQMQSTKDLGGQLEGKADNWDFYGFEGESLWGVGNRVLLSWRVYSAVLDTYTNKSDQISVFMVFAGSEYAHLSDRKEKDHRPLTLSSAVASGGATSVAGGFGITLDNTQSNLMLTYGEGGESKFSYSDTSVMPTKKTTPILVSNVRNGSTATSKVYVHDTKAIATNVITGLSENLNIDRVALGAMIGANGTVDPYFAGRIGEVLIFSRALHEDEIAYVESYLKRKWLNSKTEEKTVSDLDVWANINVAEGSAGYRGSSNVTKEGSGTLALGGNDIGDVEAKAGELELKNQSWKSRAAIWVDASEASTITTNEQNRVTSVKNKGYAGGEFVQNLRRASALENWTLPTIPNYKTDGINSKGVLEFLGDSALVLNSYTNTSTRDMHVYAIVKTTGYCVSEDGFNVSGNSAIFSFANDALSAGDYDNVTDGILLFDVETSVNRLCVRVGNNGGTQGVIVGAAGRDNVQQISSVDEAREGSKSGEPYLAVVHNTYAHSMFAQVLESDETLAVPYQIGPRNTWNEWNIFERTYANIMTPFNINLVQLGGGIADNGATACSGNSYHTRMWFGQMGEFIAFDKELSREEETELIAYLRKKWFGKGDGSETPPAFLSGETLNPSFVATANVKLGEGTTLESNISKQSIASLEVENDVQWVRAAPSAEPSGFGFFSVAGNAVINGNQSLEFSPEPGTTVDLITANALGGTAAWAARIAGKQDSGSYSVNSTDTAVRLSYNGGTLLIIRSFK